MEIAVQAALVALNGSQIVTDDTGQPACAAVIGFHPQIPIFLGEPTIFCRLPEHGVSSGQGAASFKGRMAVGDTYEKADPDAQGYERIAQGCSAPESGGAPAGNRYGSVMFHCPAAFPPVADHPQPQIQYQGGPGQ